MLFVTYCVEHTSKYSYHIIKIKFRSAVYCRPHSIDGWWILEKNTNMIENRLELTYLRLTKIQSSRIFTVGCCCCLEDTTSWMNWKQRLCIVLNVEMIQQIQQPSSVGLYRKRYWLVSTETVGAALFYIVASSGPSKKKKEGPPTVTAGATAAGAFTLGIIRIFQQPLAASNFLAQIKSRRPSFSAL